ncbi:M48 family metalloprotease [Umezawaea sp. NPDC059074]|uniref:SecDF P1 head subdomain-containing protein n=1 Tax=Umezawaea sp. NPDC059074 TaxID=3346716 RepID=UPI0036C77868
MRPPSRLEVRAFPSDTTPLLVLLAAMVLSNVLFAAIWLAGLDYGGATVGNVLTKLEIPLSPALAGWGLLVWWRLRRSTPLATTPFTEAAAVIGRLVAEARLKTRPDVRLGSRLGRRAFVTGTPGRPLLLMGPELLGLCTTGERGRVVFEAVVRHELAHLRAGDLTGYQVVTVLRATIPTTGFFVLFTAWLGLLYDDASAGDVLIAAGCVAVQALIAELVARAYLRAREHQADLHATRYGDEEGLLAAVGDAPVARSWLRRHPGGAARASALADPGRLLATAPAQLLLGAIAAGSALITLHHLLVNADSPENAAVLTGVLVGVPLALFTAFGIWRATWRATTAGERPRTLLSAALLVAGLVVGGRIALFPVAFGGKGLPLTWPLLTAYAVASLLLCLWLTAMGRAWYRHDPRASRLRLFLAYAVPATAVVGGWTFAVLWTWSAHLIDDLTSFAARATVRDLAFGVIPVLVVLIVAATTAGPALRSGVPLATAIVAALAVSGGLYWLHDAVTSTRVSTVEIREVLTATPGGCTPPPTPRPAPTERRTACAADGSEHYDLGPAALTTVDVLTAAAVQDTGSGSFVVEVTLTPDGATRWAALTETLATKRAAILVDDVVESAPYIAEPLRGEKFQISQPSTTFAAASALADRITGR